MNIGASARNSQISCYVVFCDLRLSVTLLIFGYWSHTENSAYTKCTQS